MYRRIVLIACLLALSACSRTELLYRNADWLAYRWADGLLDANQTQSEQWPLLFEQVMHKHRRDLLPQLVALLQQASQQANDGLSRGDLDCLWQQANDLIESHTRLIVPTAVALLSDISVAQMRHLQVELDERNADYREDYLDPDPRQREAARTARFIERIEHWTGDLSSGQARLVEAAVGRMPDVAAEWLHYRKRQQNRLLAIVRAHNPQALEDFLIAWWIDQADRGSVLLRAYPQLRDGWIQMLAALDATLDERQRTHLLDTLTDLRDDLAGELEPGIDGSTMPPADGRAQCSIDAELLQVATHPE